MAESVLAIDPGGGPTGDRVVAERAVGDRGSGSLFLRNTYALVLNTGITGAPVRVNGA